jgi:hypothetical protein
MNRLLGFFPFFLVTMVVGCGDENKPKYANVSGTVNYNGKPIEKGTITFSVVGQAPTVADINDGKFTGQAMVGTNTISISAKKKGKSQLPSGEAGKAAEIQIKGYKQKLQSEGGGGDYDPTMVEYIPAEWNTESKQTRVVETGAANNFEFDIKGR